MTLTSSNPSLTSSIASLTSSNPAGARTCVPRVTTGPAATPPASVPATTTSATRYTGYGKYLNHFNNIWVQVLGCVCQPRYSGSNCSTPLPIYGYSALDPVGGDGGDGALYAGNMLDSNKSCSHGEGPYWVNAR